MKYWIPCELHTHTTHSDGRQSLMELAEKAKKEEIRCIALTDHNTISGNSDKYNVMKQTGVHIISGLEWTTFYGHMVILGIKRYEDWRNIEIDNIDASIEEIHDHGAIVGIAHPFRIGSPLCTGCYWEYKVKDWNNIDYIEVMSSDVLKDKSSNMRTLDFWTDLLNQGFRPTAVYGRDWHSGGNAEKNVAVTYLGIDTLNGDFDSAVLNAIVNGAAVVTSGPLLLMECKLKNVNKIYTIGETVQLEKSDGCIDIDVSIDFTVRKDQWRLGEKMALSIVSNKGEIARVPVDVNRPNFSFDVLHTGIKWIRAELYGFIDQQQLLIALTNPIYFKM